MRHNDLPPLDAEEKAAALAAWLRFRAASAVDRPEWYVAQLEEIEREGFMAGWAASLEHTT